MYRFLAGVLAGSLALAAVAVPAAATEHPETPPAPAEATPDAAPPTVTVQPGDTLWAISGVELGDPARWREIAVYNEVPDPNVIPIGLVLKIPTEPVALPPLPAPTPAPRVTSKPTTKAASAQHTHAVPKTTPTTHIHAGSAQSSGTSSNLHSIAQCESGGDYGAVSSSGKYRGAYQFDSQTWQSVGGSGDPAAASAAEQDARAQALYNQRGSQPWPVCG